MNTLESSPTVIKIDCRPYIRSSIYSGESFHIKTMTLGRYKSPELDKNLTTKSLDGNAMRNLFEIKQWKSHFQATDYPNNEWKYGIDVNDISVSNYENQKMHNPESTTHTNRTLMDTIDSKNDPELAHELDQLAQHLGMSPKRTASDIHVKSTEPYHYLKDTNGEIVTMEQPPDANYSLRRCSRSDTKPNSNKNKIQPGRLHSGSRAIRRFLTRISSSLHRSISRHPHINRNTLPESNKRLSNSMTTVHSVGITTANLLDNSTKLQTNCSRKIASQTLPTIRQGEFIQPSNGPENLPFSPTTRLFHENVDQPGTLDQSRDSSSIWPSNKLYIVEFPNPDKSALANVSDESNRTCRTSQTPVYLNASISAFGYGRRSGWEQFSQSLTRHHTFSLSDTIPILKGQLSSQESQMKPVETSIESAVDDSENSPKGNHFTPIKYMGSVNSLDELDSSKLFSVKELTEYSTQSLSRISDQLIGTGSLEDCPSLDKEDSVNLQRNETNLKSYIQRNIDTDCLDQGHTNDAKLGLSRRHSVASCHSECDKKCSDRPIFKQPIEPTRSTTPPNLHRNSASAVLIRAEQKRQRQAYFHEPGLSNAKTTRSFRTKPDCPVVLEED